MDSITCYLCNQRFKTTTIKEHLWRCYNSSIVTTAPVDSVDWSILTADVHHAASFETPASPIYYPNDEISHSWDDVSDSDPIPVMRDNCQSAAFSFHPNIDLNKLAPDNDSTDEEGAGLDDDQSFGYISLVNHLGEQDLDPTWSSNVAGSAGDRPPSATTLMDLYEIDDDGNASNIKCQMASEGYLKNGRPEDYSMFELIQILDSHRCPRKMVGEIINWCHNSQLQGVDDFGNLPRQRSTFTKKIENSMKKVGVTTPSPSVQWVQLESTPECGRQTVPVITWDFEEQLRSLLSDMTLFSDLNNLIVHPTNPFLPVPETMQDLVGQWYIQTAKERGITGEDGRLLMGVVFGQDRAHASDNGRWSVEPVLVTSDFLSPAARENPNAWRIIALIPFLNDKSNAQATIAKNRVDSQCASIKNYHVCLKAAYASVAKLHGRAITPNRGNEHNRDGDYHFTVNLTLGEHMRPMNIVCPINHIIVDGEGADKATARNQIKAGSFGRISRACHCTPDDADNAQLTCTELNKNDIVSDYNIFTRTNLTEKKKKSERHDLFVKKHQVHPVENGLWFLDYGANKNGPYKALRVDPMHAGELGIIMYVVKVLSGGDADKKLVTK